MFQNPEGIPERIKLKISDKSFKIVDKKLDSPSSSLDHFNLAEHLRLQGESKKSMEQFSKGFKRAEKEKYPMYPELKAQLQIKQAQAKAESGNKEGAKKVLGGIATEFEGRFLGDEAKRIAESI